MTMEQVGACLVVIGVGGIVGWLVWVAVDEVLTLIRN